MSLIILRLTVPSHLAALFQICGCSYWTHITTTTYWRRCTVCWCCCPRVTPLRPSGTGWSVFLTGGSWTRLRSSKSSVCEVSAMVRSLTRRSRVQSTARSRIEQKECEVSAFGKISDCQPEGSGFNPRRCWGLNRRGVKLAQLVRYLTTNQEVPCSIPGLVEDWT